MAWSIGKKIASGFAVALVALVIIGAVSYSTLTTLSSNSAWVVHTVRVLQTDESLSANLARAENNARAYVMSGGEGFRSAVHSATDLMHRDLTDLRELTKDNPRQQKRLDDLEPALSARLYVSTQLMRLRDMNLPDREEQEATAVKMAQPQSEAVRVLVTAIEDEERELLRARQERADETTRITSLTIQIGTVAAFVLVGLVAFLISRSISKRLGRLQEGAVRLGHGDYDYRVNLDAGDEIGELASVFDGMAAQIQKRESEQSERDWLKSSLARFTRLFQGQNDVATVAQTVLSELATLVDARHATFYVQEASSVGPRLMLRATYAADNAPRQLGPGQGLVGQALVDRTPISLLPAPTDYVRVGSSLGDTPPAQILVLPAVFENEAKAVVELAVLTPFTELQRKFLTDLAENLGVVVHTVQARMQTEALLREARELSENLRVRQAELSEKNEELEVQTSRLRKSEQLLQAQQDELKQTNDELEQTNEELQQSNAEMEDKAQLLAEQKSELQRKNREIDDSRRVLELQTRELTITSKYKSEFLANMSHELRTPLNSLLILSKILAENPENNLTAKQVQYAGTIYASGNDLLELINDILDLSKIESGTVAVDVEPLNYEELVRQLTDTFAPVAQHKNLSFETQLAPDLPPSPLTDVRRLRQVLKNLLSNALKFTAQGTVGLRIATARSGWEPQARWLNEADAVIAFTVTDSGIGIAQEKLALIFEAFQQADSGTARKYGGTGLGLSISREIARLLGGSLQVRSQVGEGSSFTLYLPRYLPPQLQERNAEETSTTARLPQLQAPPPEPTFELPALPELSGVAPVADDRNQLQGGEPILLIIEDDRNFAGVLLEFAHEKGFKAVIAGTAAEAIGLAQRIAPAAITLDLMLPDTEGWVVLDRLKHDARTRHIPVHVISVEEQRQRSLKLGAVSHLLKPVTRETIDQALSDTLDFIRRPVKNLLVVEDDAVQRQSLSELIGNNDVHTFAVATANEALEMLQNEHIDCVVVDLVLPDMPGADLIREIHQRLDRRSPPIIVFTGKALTRKEETELRLLSDSIILKDVRSPERLLEETALFLHRKEAGLPANKRRMIENAHKSDPVLAGRKVLVVDDDVRNIFAITSALESYRMQVLYAESGQGAIDTLRTHPDIEAVLMDVMMPGMDGLEAIRQIRLIGPFSRLPIVSITAKAMKGDRERCLNAGASDYIVKPLDMDQLRSVLRVWLYR